MASDAQRNHPLTKRGIGSTRLVEGVPLKKRLVNSLPGEGPNIEFTYRYRDADNFKTFSRLVFAGPGRLADLDVIRQRLALSWGEDGFIAEQVGLLALQTQLTQYDSQEYEDDGDEVMNPSDHPWHEIDVEEDLRASTAVPNAPMSWEALVEAFASVGEWDPGLSPFNDTGPL